jgi:hypothetical protein
VDGGGGSKRGRGKPWRAVVANSLEEENWRRETRRERYAGKEKIRCVGGPYPADCVSCVDRGDGYPVKSYFDIILCIVDIVS